MNRFLVMMTIVFLFLPVQMFSRILHAASDSAMSENNSNISSYPLGLSFSAERDYSLIQSPDKSKGSYAMLIGMRYTFHPSFSFDLQFSTGTEYHTQPALSSSQDDRYQSGGARFGIESRIIPNNIIHPILFVAYERVTILQNNSGYNGNGIIIRGGGEYRHPSKYFSLQVNMLYQLQSYQPYSANPSSTINVDSYTQHDFGISFLLLVHFRQLL